MIRIIARLFAFTVALTAFLHVVPLFAYVTQPVVWISSTGSDSNPPCTAALPCQSFVQALGYLESGGQLNCLDSPGVSEPDVSTTVSVTIDCAGVYEPASDGAGVGAFSLSGTNQVVKIRNLTISGAAGGYPAIKVTGSGTLILENCVFENFTASGAGPALDIEPNGAFNLVVTNSRISNSAAGVVIKPAAGGSVTATFNGVTIADNTGGGMKTDTTNGAVSVDISNSTINNNAGNGLNAVSGAGGTNMLNIRNSVIARNGSAGVQANGASAAALVNNTLLDSNTAGATSAIGGGRILTYGNNSIVGSAGSGFTGPTPLQ
jgi:Right handed beta helix region